MKTIKAACGTLSVVDDNDYERFGQYNWRLRKDGYFVRKMVIDGKYKTVSMHRLIMNALPGTEIDHINRDKLDNRKSNLRMATRSQNNMNVGVQNRPGKTSKYKGVCLHKPSNKWRALIGINRKQKLLGYHDREEDAALAYNAAAKELFGEFAYLNSL